MLVLKRVVNDYEFLKCQISKELIGYGDWYYQDDEDGLIVKFTVYQRIKDKRKRDTFDYSLLEQANSEREYKEILKRAERELFEVTVLDRKILGKDNE